MSGININKTTGIFDGLKVYNKNTRFEITDSGNYTHRTKNSNIVSSNLLTNICDGNILYKSNTGNININCLSNNKNINLKSGNNTNRLINILENDTDLITPEISFINDTLFDNLTSVNDVVNNSSIILESTDNEKKGICLYSNNEINQL